MTKADVISFPANDHASRYEREQFLERQSEELVQRVSEAIGRPNRLPFIEANQKVWEAEGDVLRQLREDAALTQRQVADGLGVSVPRIQRLENGAPVREPMLLKKAYRMFLQLHKEGVQ